MRLKRRVPEAHERLSPSTLYVWFGFFYACKYCPRWSQWSFLSLFGFVWHCLLWVHCSSLLSWTPLSFVVYQCAAELLQPLVWVLLASHVLVFAMVDRRKDIYNLVSEPNGLFALFVLFAFFWVIPLSLFVSCACFYIGVGRGKSCLGVHSMGICRLKACTSFNYARPASIWISFCWCKLFRW